MKTETRPKVKGLISLKKTLKKTLNKRNKMNREKLRKELIDFIDEVLELESTKDIGVVLLNSVEKIDKDVHDYKSIIYQGVGVAMLLKKVELGEK